MAIPSASNEEVRYDILIEAQAAIKAMRELLKYTSDNTTKMTEFTTRVLEDSKRWGVSWQQALLVYKQLNAELSKSKKGTLFGQTGGQDLFKQSANYLTSLEEAGRLQAQVGSGAKEMGDAVENASHRSVRSIDAMRIALGVLVSMLIFNVIQAFQNMARGAINGLKELETAMYNLGNAERILSERGIGITPEDLQAIINKVRELDPLLSKIQATELVSRIATNVAPAVGFDKKQIEEFSKAVAVLAIQNKGLGYSFEEVEKQMTDAFLTGKVSQGINRLGVKINDQIVKDEALRLGLVKTADEFDNLTGKMESQIKAQAMLSIITQKTNRDVGHLPDYLKTADASFGIFQAKFQDFLTMIGQKLGPVLRQVFTDLAKILQRIIDYWEKNNDAANSFVFLLGAVAKFGIALIDIFLKLVGVFAKIGTAIYGAFSKLPIIGKAIEKYSATNPMVDTPTGISANAVDKEKENQSKIAEAVKDGQEKIQDIMQESADKKLDIEQQYQDKLADINRDYANKLEDIARNTAEKREDALRNYEQKVEDINRDTNEKIAEAQQDARQKEIDREKEYQNRLRELREKFLFDLEDALRERDARQVLRLIRQYNMDKKSLEEKRKLDAQEAKRDLQRKIADLERERQLKLEAAKREYDDKLQEIAIGEQRALAEANIWRQRQLRDAQTWYQRQLQQQREYLQRKLRDLAEALIKEYQLTAAGMAAIYSLVGSYYGSGGLLASLMNATLGTGGYGSTNPTGGSSTGYGGAYVNQQAGIGSGLYNPYDVRNRYAEGGTLIATRPTTATFGEDGPEQVTITPLSRPGRNTGKVFGTPESNQMSGEVKIRLELSPDLEARITDSTLENLSVHIERIGREK